MYSGSIMYSLLTHQILLPMIKGMTTRSGINNPQTWQNLRSCELLSFSYRTRHTMKKRRGVANSITVTLSAHDTWFYEKYSTACYIQIFKPCFWLTTAQFLFCAGPLLAMQKVSHTWVRHVKQLIPWNTPFKWVFWSLALPIVMKRLVSSHVSLAQVPSLPAHQIINTTRDRETDIDKEADRREIWCR